MDIASYVSQDSNAKIQEKTSLVCLLQAFTTSLTSTIAQNSKTILSWVGGFRNGSDISKRRGYWILHPHNFAARECLQWWNRVEGKAFNFFVSLYDEICNSDLILLDTVSTRCDRMVSSLITGDLGPASIRDDAIWQLRLLLRLSLPKPSSRAPCA